MIEKILTLPSGRSTVMRASWTGSSRPTTRRTGRSSSGSGAPRRSMKRQPGGVANQSGSSARVTPSRASARGFRKTTFPSGVTTMMPATLVARIPSSRSRSERTAVSTAWRTLTSRTIAWMRLSPVRRTLSSAIKAEPSFRRSRRSRTTTEPEPRSPQGSGPSSASPGANRLGTGSRSSSSLL